MIAKEKLNIQIFILTFDSYATYNFIIHHQIIPYIYLCIVYYYCALMLFPIISCITFVYYL